MIGHRSVRTAFAVSVLALVVGVAPSIAASPVGDWKLKGDFKNAAGSTPRLSASNDVGSFESVKLGGGRRDVWYNGVDGNGGILISGINGRARRTYTIDFLVNTSEISSYNHFLSFGAGDDGKGGSFDPGSDTFPDTGLYFNSDGIRMYGDTTDFFLASDALATGQWIAIRITRQAAKSGVRKVAIFVEGQCAGAADDHTGAMRFYGGKGLLLQDDGGESYPTYIADVRMWNTAELPEPCPITVS